MDKSLILSKIIEFKKFKSDADFARFLGISPQNLSKWKQRNSYDTELIYTKCPELNPDWLLTGKGEMLKNQIKEQELQNNDEFISLLKENNVLLKSQLKDKEDKEVLYKEKIAYKTKEIERLKIEIERLKGKDIYKMEGKIESQRLQIESLRGKVPL